MGDHRMRLVLESGPRHLEWWFRQMATDLEQTARHHIDFADINATDETVVTEWYADTDPVTGERGLLHMYQGFGIQVPQARPIMRVSL